jgi:hypothetical protein
MATWHSLVEPPADDVVVASVAHWLRTKQITCARDATAAA